VIRSSRTLKVRLTPYFDFPRQRGKKAVHFAVKFEIFDDVLPVGLEGAAIVVKGDAGDFPDQVIGEPGGDFSGEKLVLSFFSPAADDVSALVDFFDQSRDVGGIVLKIAVHGDDQVAPGMVEAGGHGGGLSEIFPQLNDFKGWAGLGQPAGDVKCVVGAAVVDEDHFKIDVEPLHDGQGLIDERGEIFGFVVERDDNRKFIGGGHLSFL
jgi:hypothetical protein